MSLIDHVQASLSNRYHKKVKQILQKVAKNSYEKFKGKTVWGVTTTEGQTL